MIADRTGLLERSALFIPILAAVFLLTFRIDAPYIYPHEANSAIYSLAARNHLEHGLTQTLGFNLLETPRNAEKVYYLNHPGTLSMILAVFFGIFGESETVGRSVPIIFSLAAIALLFVAVRRRWGPAAAFYSSLFAALVPMTACYGKMINFEPLILPLGILTLDAAGREQDGARSNRDFGIAVAAAAAAAAIDYGAVSLVPALLVGSARKKTAIWCSLTIGAVLFLHLIMLSVLISPRAVFDLFGRASERAGIGAPLPLLSFAKFQIMNHYAVLFTHAGVAISFAGLFLLERKYDCRLRFALGSLAWGAAYVLIFRQAAVVHDYWQYYFIPATGVLFGVTLSRINRYAALILLAVFAVSSFRTTVIRHYNDSEWYKLEFSAVEFAGRQDDVTEPVFTSKRMRTWHPQYYTGRQFIYDKSLPTEFATAANSDG